MTNINIMLDGTYTVLVTPFTDDDMIDYDSIRNWLDIQYMSDITGLVILGTTSESPTLTFDEKINIVKFVHSYNESVSSLSITNKKILVIGVGGNYTNETSLFTQEIKQYADAIMVTVPYYNKPPQRGISAHFKYIAKKHPEIPIMMYNVPSRTGINMDPETMIDVINECPNVIALKEANGNFETTEKFISLLKTTNRILGSTFKIFSGDDLNIITHCTMGASGVISVASNIIPFHISSIVRMNISRKSDIDTIKLHFGKITPFVKYLMSCDTNPIGIKEIMYFAHIYKNNNMRLPLVTLELDKQNELHKLYSHLIFTQNH